MPYEKEIEELRLKLVTAYVEALNTLSIDPIIESIHPDFKYMLYGSFGIGTELRYLGFLYKCFRQMKQEGKSLNAELVWVEDGTYKFPVVKLHPPIDTRVLYQHDWYYMYKWEIKSIEHEVVLYVRIKENRIFRVLCENALTVETGKWMLELNKPTQTFILADTSHSKEKSAKVLPKKTESGFEYVIVGYLPYDQQRAWDEVLAYHLPFVRLEDNSRAVDYADYEAFYDWWTTGRPVTRGWFRNPR